MIFQFLKKLAAGVKVKNYSSIHGIYKSIIKVAQTDRTGTKRIMVFGDSNAYRPGNSKKSWPKLLEAKDPLYLKIFNESCDGRTTKYDIGDCNGLTVISEKIFAHAPLDFVVVMLGTNDVKNKYGPPSPTEIAEGMSRILEIIKNNADGAKTILLTPPPLGNVKSGDLANAQPRIHKVADEYRRLSRNHNVQTIDIYSILEVNTDLDSDRIHLNALGRKKTAKAVWAFLQEFNPPFPVFDKESVTRERGVI